MEVLTCKEKQAAHPRFVGCFLEELVDSFLHLSTNCAVSASLSLLTLSVHVWQPQQRPVYGYAQGQAPIPVAQPAHGQPAHGEPVYTKATEPPV